MPERIAHLQSPDEGEGGGRRGIGAPDDKAHAGGRDVDVVDEQRLRERQLPVADGHHRRQIWGRREVLLPTTGRFFFFYSQNSPPSGV